MKFCLTYLQSRGKGFISSFYPPYSINAGFFGENIIKRYREYTFVFCICYLPLLIRWGRGDFTQETVLKHNDKTPKLDKQLNPSVNNPVCMVRKKSARSASNCELLRTLQIKETKYKRETNTKDK